MGTLVDEMLNGKSVVRSDNSQSSLMSLCYRDSNTETEEDAMLEELYLVNLGFTVSKTLNWDGVNIPQKTSISKAFHHRLNNFLAPDCFVFIEDVEYRCHLLPLQCYSKFFQKQKPLQPVRLPSELVGTKIFEFIYAWILSEKADYFKMIQRDLIVDLSRAAIYLEISELEDQCKDILQFDKFFTEGSAFILYLMARNRELKDIQAMMVPKIRKFFLNIVCSLDFLVVLNADDVCAFLSSDFISVHCELEVFLIGMRWLLHEWPVRRAHVLEVLSCVRYGLIPPHHLVNIRRNAFCPLFSDVIASDPGVIKLMDDGVAYSITKGWQAGEGKEFETCVAQQKLKKPKPRNWSSEHLNYDIETYEDFHRELALLRRKMKFGGTSSQESLSFQCWTPDPIQSDDSETELILEEQSLTELGFRLSKDFDWKHSVEIREKSNLYANMKERVRNYSLPDCTITLGDDIEYKCHMLLLQCYSQYCSNILDRRLIKFAKCRVSPRSFELMYQWMQSDTDKAHLILKRDVILEIYSTAQCFEVKELINLCWTTISNIKFFYEGTAFLMYLMAKENAMAEIQNLMALRIGKFFLTLVSSKDFLELDVEDICLLLGSDNICVHSEVEVFMSAVRWLRHNWSQRMHLTAQVMSCIRFGLIPSWQLIDIRRNPENNEFHEITRIPEVDKMIDSGLSCTIEREWYSDSNEKYMSSLNEQGLAVPALRNMYDLKKDYHSYKDFIRSLMQRRKEHLEEAQKQQLLALSKNNYTAHPSHLPTLKSVQQFDRNSRLLEQSRNKCLKMQANISDRRTNREFDDLRSLQGTPTDNKKSEETGISTRRLSPRRHLSGAGDTPGSVVKGTREQKPLTDRLTAEIESVESNRRSENTVVDDFQTSYLRPYPRARSNSVDERGKHLLSRKARPRPSLSPETIERIRQENATESDASSHERSQSLELDVIGPAQRGSVELIHPLQDTVLVFGGSNPFQLYNPTSNNGKSIYRLDHEKCSWDLVGDLPQPRHHHSVVAWNNKVYVVGGTNPNQKTEHGRSVLVGTVWSLDVDRRIWLRETDLNTPRKDFGLVQVYGKIYVIGGRDKHGNVLRSVECYNPQTKRWSDGPPLNIARYGLGAAFHDNSIWVAGGTAHKGDTGSVERLHFQNHRLIEKWVQHSTLRFPRSFCSLISSGDELYLVGGVVGSGDQRKSLQDVDVWSDHEWKLRFTMSTGRHCQAVTICGTEIMILGGASTKLQSSLKDVYVYCCHKQKQVKSLRPLPQPLSGHAAITIPKF